MCKLINRYYERSDDAGRVARRLLREMDSLWVFLAHQGVEPTNNRGERALRFGVQWRKRSLGTASDKGNRWVERILSLKETCRLRVSGMRKRVKTVALKIRTTKWRDEDATGSAWPSVATPSQASFTPRVFPSCDNSCLQ